MICFQNNCLSKLDNLFWRVYVEISWKLVSQKVVSVCKTRILFCKSEEEWRSLNPKGMIRSHVNVFKNTKWLEVLVLSTFLIGRTFASQTCFRVFGELKKLQQTYYVPNRTHLYLANLLWEVWRNTTKLCSGSKTLHSTCSGNYSPSSVNLASEWVRAKKALLVLGMKKKGLERKRKMDDGVGISFASEGTDLFVELWEVQPCFWDPE